MIKVIDNFLPQMYANQIEYETKHELMYRYREYTSPKAEYVDSTVVIDKNTYDCGQFVCLLLHSDYDIDYKFKDYFEQLKAVVFTAREHIEKDICSVDRVKVNLLLQQSQTPEYHYTVSHVDKISNCYYSMLYYINDSDGDTFMFNEFQNVDRTLPTELTLCQRISPKKNRAVIFESNRYHASSNPRKHATRFVINFVMKVE